jgi:hypothetical protein
MKRGASALLAAMVMAGLATMAWRAKADDTAGPATGSEAPLLHISPFNADGGAYCVTCRAGKQPAVIAFVSHNDEASQQLITAVDAAYRANKDKSLNAAVIVVGGGADADGLKQFVLDHKLAVPAAVAEPGSGDLPQWKLGDKGTSLLCLVNQHKINGDLPTPTPQDVTSGVARICP